MNGPLINAVKMELLGLLLFKSCVYQDFCSLEVELLYSTFLQNLTASAPEDACNFWNTVP